MCLGSLSGTRLTANDEGLRIFESEVRPVLMEHCQSCHGAKKQEAGLRLDFRQGLLHGGDSGAAVVPGKPDESLLIAAVRHIGDVQMPPKQKLKDKQIESLVQ